MGPRIPTSLLSDSRQPTHPWLRVRHNGRDPKSHHQGEEGQELQLLVGLMYPLGKDRDPSLRSEPEGVQNQDGSWRKAGATGGRTLGPMGWPGAGSKQGAVVSGNSRPRATPERALFQSWGTAAAPQQEEACFQGSEDVA